MDLERSLRDGYSTAGGAGTGLGAIRRLSSDFEVYSPPGRGTALLARLWPGSRKPAPLIVQYGGVAVPMRGERICGDAWSVALSADGGAVVMVADGLGHGPQAAEASAEAVRVFRQHAHLPDADLMDYLHGALRPTRGAAVAVARLVPGAREVRFAGSRQHRRGDPKRQRLPADDLPRGYGGPRGAKGSTVHVPVARRREWCCYTRMGLTAIFLLRVTPGWQGAIRR